MRVARYRRAGRCWLIVTTNGFAQRVTDEIVVEDGGCHVILVALEINLSTTG